VYPFPQKEQLLQYFSPRLRELKILLSKNMAEARQQREHTPRSNLDLGITQATSINPH
jgi:hypothetical protein